MSSCGSEAEAKRFFVERVLEQAAKEGVELSAAEQYMLGFSMQDDTLDDELHASFERDHQETRYEQKVLGLLERAYDEDVMTRPGSESQWQDTYAILCQGDHYLLVMLKPVLGSSMTRLVRRILDI
jgi:hypothetical protein